MDNHIFDIYNTPTSQKFTASRMMNKINFKIDNYAFFSNIYWCRFSYNGYDSWNYAFHSHSFYEMHFCVSGEAVFQLKTGEKIKISENKFVIFPSKTLHSLDSISENFEKFVIGFDITIKESEEKNFFKTAFDKNASPKSYQASEDMQYAVAMILNRILHKNQAYKLAINELLAFVITEIAGIISVDKNVLLNQYEKEDFRLQALIQFMRDNVTLNLNTDDFAKEMNLSAKQLNRLMKLEYGMSVSEFFRLEKVKKIKEYLLTSDLSLNDIAKKLGFSDEYSMGKTFKSIAGITPGKYRIHYHK